MVEFYGQHGEDCVLWSVFQDLKTPGFFLDVGALDGKRFSNTYVFEQAGWTGMCVEAHPFYVPYVKRNRPNSIVVHAAASNENKDKTKFYANKLGSLSTLDASMATLFSTKYAKHFKGFTEIEVPMRTVDSMLEEHNIKRVQVVSIDVEGTELDVLKGFNIAKYKPRILVIEAIDKARANKIKAYLAKNKYYCPRKVTNNYYFCVNPKDREIVMSAKLEKCTHTDHPLED